MVLLVALATLTPGLAAAKGVPRAYAGIVVDAKSGKVLYESAADSLRYPASVTKVMTLYILFQELKAGKITLDTRFTVSKWAASASPTKLGIPAGQTIRVEDCIKAIVTISANDIARVIAENISGNETEFAKRMTLTARALGMSNTHYNNASGLPDPGQLTTVRDQALLGIAIYQHFPNYYEYFQTRNFKWGRRTYGNHNRLLGHDGVDGIKTGYINASGYNLLTAARTDNKHIVVVGFGFNSGGARDSKVRSLVLKYLPKARQGSYLEAALIPAPGMRGTSATSTIAVANALQVVPMPYPDFRDDDQTDVEVASTDTGEDATLVEAAQQQDPAPVVVTAKLTPANKPVDLGLQPALSAANNLAVPKASQEDVDVIGAWLSDNYRLGAPPAPLGQTRPSAPLVPPVGVGDKGQPVDPMTSGGIGAKAPDAVADQKEPPAIEVASTEAKTQPLPTGWVVQIGAAPTETGANALLSDANSRIGDLQSFKGFVERFEKNGQVFFRARFGGFNGRDDATGICNELKKAKMSCLAMQS